MQAPHHIARSYLADAFFRTPGDAEKGVCLQAATVGGLQTFLKKMIAENATRVTEEMRGEYHKLRPAIDRACTAMKMQEPAIEVIGNER